MDATNIKNPDYDKMIMMVNNMTDKELQTFVLMAQTIMLEKNILCGKDK